MYVQDSFCKLFHNAKDSLIVFLHRYTALSVVPAGLGKKVRAVAAKVRCSKLEDVDITAAS